MNDNDLNDLKGKSSLYILGKEFIIVIVVIFSAVSFTLGYFVGKNSIDKKPENILQKAEITPLPQKQEPMPVQAEVQPAGQPPAQTQPQQKNIQAAHSQENKKNEQQKSVSQTEKTPPETAKEAVKETKSSNSTDKKSKKREIIYTVQIGAFRNAAEAENFKTKYEKKGYKTYITVSKNNKNKKTYKIRTGEFKERNDAEILSLKLKKTEGLNTFVTFKTNN